MASKKIALTNQEIECLKYIIPKVLDDYFSDDAIESIQELKRLGCEVIMYDMESGLKFTKIEKVL